MDKNTHTKHPRQIQNVKRLIITPLQKKFKFKLIG